MISNQSLACPKGASLTFEIDMDTGSDLTGATAQWALCESWFDQAKVYLTKTGSSDGLFIGQDAGVWKITVNLAPTDTLDIPSGLLYHDCKVLLQSGDVVDVANGPFSLDPSVNILLTNSPITRNVHAVQLLGRLGQGATLTVSQPVRNLLAAQTFGGLGQSATAADPIALTATQALTGIGQAATAAGVVSPVFQAYFTAITSLPAEISFSRPSTGTYFDASGILQTASINTPRFDHAWNGSAWVAAGLFIEEQRTNLFIQSGNLGTGTVNEWDPRQVTNVSGVTAPDGSSTGTTLTEDTSTNYHSLLGGAFNRPSVSASQALTVSVHVKAGTRRYIVLAAANGPFGFWVTLDTQTMTITEQVAGAGGGTVTGAGLQNIGGGWYRVYVSGTLGTTDVVIPFLSGATAATGNSANPSYTGTSSTIIAWGIDFEAGPFATSYIPTTTDAVTRSADIPSASSPLDSYLAAGPSVWEFQDEATGTIARSAYAAGAFDWPVNKWYRSMGVYPAGTDTSSHMAVGSPY